MKVVDSFKTVSLYTWDGALYQVDVEGSCIFNSFNLEAAKGVFNEEAEKLGSRYVNDLTKANFQEAELGWQQYWEEYMAEHPDFDGFDYADEREAYMMSIFGGDAKHL